MRSEILCAVMIVVSLFGCAETPPPDSPLPLSNAGRRYGHLASLPGAHAARMHAVRFAAGELTPSADLRPQCPPIYDQGALGACEGNGGAAAFDVLRAHEGLPFLTPSRLMIYYNARYLEHSTRQDAGCETHDMVAGLQKWGVCAESLWPYNIAKFAARPPVKAYRAALPNKGLIDETVDNTDPVAIKSAVAEGLPVIIGIAVYESFESDAVARTGLVPVPDTKAEQLLGGHCILIVGYDDVRQVFIVRNSWGVGWGDKGYCYIPYAYITDPDLGSDYWVIRSVPATAAHPTDHRKAA